MTFHEMDTNGVNVPEDKKTRGIPDISPSADIGQSGLLNPVNQQKHGKNKKDMGELMDIKAFNADMPLSGEGGFGQKKQKRKKKKGYLVFPKIIHASLDALVTSRFTTAKVNFIFL